MLKPNTDTTAQTASVTSSLWKNIWNMEAELGLLQVQINGVQAWPVIRESVCNRLYWESVQFRCAEINSTAPTFDRLKQLAGKAVREYAEPVRTEGRYDTVFVTFVRKNNRNGSAPDEYSAPVLRDPGFGRMLVMDTNAGGRLQSIPNGDVRDRDGMFALSVVKGMAEILPFLPGSVSLRKQVCRYLKTHAGTGDSISAFDIALRLSCFRAGRHLWRNLFQKSGADRLVMLRCRGSQAISAAAEDCGIPVYELQHGMIGRYHAAYHFPGRPYVPHETRTMLTFGSFWNDTVDHPRNMKLAVIGSDFHATHPCAGHAPAKTRKVFVPSQGHVGTDLFSLVVRTARMAPQWSFVFRPHPNENPRLWDSLLAEQKEARPDNLTISSPKEDRFESMKECEVQIGVYSTVLFEGMVMGLRTIVASLPGHENMLDVVEHGDAILAGNSDEMLAALESAPRCRDTERYYAAPVPSLAALCPGR